MATTAVSSPFSARLNRIEVSATIAMTAEAAKLRAKGIDLCDMGMGEPHFNTPRHIKDAGIAAIEQNFTKYTAVGGVPELRKAIVKRHATDFGSNYTPDEAVASTGGKQALFNAIQVLVDHGDEVIIQVPGLALAPADLCRRRRRARLSAYRRHNRASDYLSHARHHSQ